MANFEISLTNKNRTRPALCVFRQRQTVNIKLATVAEECKFWYKYFSLSNIISVLPGS